MPTPCNHTTRANLEPFAQPRPGAGTGTGTRNTKTTPFPKPRRYPNRPHKQDHVHIATTTHARKRYRNHGSRKQRQSHKQPNPTHQTQSPRSKYHARKRHKFTLKATLAALTTHGNSVNQDPNHRPWTKSHAHRPESKPVPAQTLGTRPSLSEDTAPRKTATPAETGPV